MIYIFINFILSLSTFFFGMILMTKSIMKNQKHKLIKPIKLIIKHPLLGVLIGIIITIFTQSSSATSILVISFVNSGLIGLYEATAIIMGANIGTTFTAQLISLNIYNYIHHILFISIILYYLNLNNYSKLISKFFIGLSFLFIGMHLMTKSLLPLKSFIGFKTMIQSVSYSPLKGILAGTLVTALIQSSSTSIALLQSLSTTGIVPLSSALPIVIGQNIGTCVTTIFSSFVTDINGKRTAFIHIFMNTLGAFIIYPFIRILTKFVIIISPDNIVKQIANSHTLFNIIFVLIFFPFLKYIVILSKKIIR